jgi:hypothetical protein
MGMNHKVEFKREETIAALAARCWTLSRQQRPFIFDVVGFIKDVLIVEDIDSVVHTRGRRKGKLAVSFFDREFIQDDPAYVEFASDQRDNYVTLYVDNKIWRLAENGDSNACEILAHEIGHILLHDHYANAFSTDGKTQKLFEGTSQEDFAEWQAITFTGHLLIPTYVAQKFPDPKILAAATNTPERLAKDRSKAVQDIKKILSRTYEGDICSGCYNFTLVRNGCTTTCDTCGQVERA